MSGRPPRSGAEFAEWPQTGRMTYQEHGPRFGFMTASTANAFYLNHDPRGAVGRSEWGAAHQALRGHGTDPEASLSPNIRLMDSRRLILR